MRLPYGYTVELYDGSAFDGTKEIIEGGMFVEAATEEFPCYNLKELDNKVLSDILTVHF